MQSFFKYHGAGNDFILIDLCRSTLSVDLPALARALCDRRHGIGADGLLLVLDSTVADYRMRIFNADGSEPAMCGNGIRCLTDYVQREKSAPLELTIETMHSTLKCRKIGDQIAVDLGAPSVLHWPAELPQGSAFVVDTGVPHAVIFVDDLNKIDVESEGRKVRFHSQFEPHGVNVNFASIKEGNLYLRSYERGVEAETLACGTGAAAAAYAAMTLNKLPPPILIATRTSFVGLDYHPKLSFLFPITRDGKRAVEMFGSAQKVFEGTMDLNLSAHSS